MFVYKKLRKRSKWLKMSCSYQLIVVIGYELVSYLLFYSSAHCVTFKELFVCKSSTLMAYIEIKIQLFKLHRQVFRKSEFIRRNIIINKLTTMFLLLHKHRKGLCVTPEPCSDWWCKAPFFFLLMPQAVLLRLLPVDFLFLSVPLIENGSHG